MARRKNSTVEGALIGVLIVFGGIFWISSKVLDEVGPVVPIVAVVAGIAGIIWYKHAQRQKRIQYLLTKYGDPLLVDRIMRRELWQGQSAQQLTDSRGRPLKIDTKLMATRKREIWKYGQTGRGRYALRVTLDNDIVIEIDHKTT